MLDPFIQLPRLAYISSERLISGFLSESGELAIHFFWTSFGAQPGLWFSSRARNITSNFSQAGIGNADRTVRLVAFIFCKPASKLICLFKGPPSAVFYTAIHNSFPGDGALSCEESATRERHHEVNRIKHNRIVASNWQSLPPSSFPPILPTIKQVSP